MDWTKGYSSRYYMSIVDRDTWRDINRIEISGGSIRKTISDLRESADINCINYMLDSEQIIRVWLDARQEGDSSHIPLFTGIATSPSTNIDGYFFKNTLQCYSLLKIADDILLPRGWYAPKGILGGKVIQTLLKPVGAIINIPESSPCLNSAIIAENGETNMTMVDKILSAMGEVEKDVSWRMRISGLGEIFIEPINKNRIKTFDSIENDIIEPSLSIDYDWYSCPNVCRAVLDDDYAIARDDNPNSPLSVQNRGREVWIEDTGGHLYEGETLAEYAKRVLKEAQQVNTSISYTRRFDPDILVSDVIGLNYPAQNLIGDFLVVDQTITLGYGAATSEGVIKL